MDDLKTLMQKRQTANNKGEYDPLVIAEAMHVAEKFVMKLFLLAIKKNPGIKEIQDYYTLAKTVSVNSLGTITEVIKDEIYKYRKEIEERRDKFFLELKIETTEKSINYLSEVLKNTYVLLSDGEKETIWTYVNNILVAIVMYKLCDKSDPIYHT